MYIFGIHFTYNINDINIYHPNNKYIGICYLIPISFTKSIIYLLWIYQGSIYLNLYSQNITRVIYNLLYIYNILYIYTFNFAKCYIMYHTLCMNLLTSIYMSMDKSIEL